MYWGIVLSETFYIFPVGSIYCWNKVSQTLFAHDTHEHDEERVHVYRRLGKVYAFENWNEDIVNCTYMHVYLFCKLNHDYDI